ncbi:hypothetical protein FRACYDRAFT_160978, partial [Fragilariopsis cylindrus CCMP1102]
NWEKAFQRLVAYKEIHKHTMVPHYYKEDPPLGTWVCRQRGKYRNDDMPSNRLDLLNSIDFAWKGVQRNNNEKWDDMFQRLVAYKEIHKHTMVPQHYDEDSKLGSWVYKQRYHYRNDDMPSNRLDLLNSIDFEWARARAKGGKWMKMFQKLVEYEKAHKHTLVPNQYDEDPSLGLWVSNQRQLFKKNELSEERLDQLHSIGFVW